MNRCRSVPVQHYRAGPLAPRARAGRKERKMSESKAFLAINLDEVADSEAFRLEAMHAVFGLPDEFENDEQEEQERS